MEKTWKIPFNVLNFLHLRPRKTNFTCSQKSFDQMLDSQVFQCCALPRAVKLPSPSTLIQLRGEKSFCKAPDICASKLPRRWHTGRMCHKVVTYQLANQIITCRLRCCSSVGSSSSVWRIYLLSGLWKSSTKLHCWAIRVFWLILCFILL